MRTWKFFLLPAFSLPAACAMNEFSDEEKEEEAKVVVPTGHGLGTQLCPYTPDEVLSDDDLPYDEEVWVMGYAVGSTIQNMENALFEVPTDYKHNILLSGDSLCADPDACIPVELSTATMQQRFSLAARPGGFRRFIVVRGTSGTYFGRPGIRKADSGYWMEGFDPSRISPPRQEWDILDKEF